MSPLQKIVHEYAWEKRRLLGSSSLLTSHLRILGYETEAVMVEFVTDQAVRAIEKVYKEKRRKYNESLPQQKELPL